MPVLTYSTFNDNISKIYETLLYLITRLAQGVRQRMSNWNPSFPTPVSPDWMVYPVLILALALLVMALWPMKTRRLWLPALIVLFLEAFDPAITDITHVSPTKEPTRQLQLVLPTNSYNPTRGSACYPPLGLVSIGTRLRTDGFPVEILDGEVISRDQIAARLGNDIVGFSVNALNNQTAIELSQIAKQRDSIVVWGGPHASQRWRQILTNRPYVDYVIVGDGEEALSLLTSGVRPDQIPNLATRDHAPRLVEVPADELPILDYRLVDAETYIGNFQRQQPAHGSVRILSFYTHKGCAFRSGHCRPHRGICVFCSIIDQAFRTKSVGRIVEEVRQYTCSYNLTHLRDTGDSITGDPKWLREVAAALTGWGPKLYVYARSDEINESVAETLAQMNVELVALGLESGDDETLRRTGKQETAEQALEAIRCLGRQGIKVRASFVLGLPGESRNSLSNTRKLIDRLLLEPNVTYIPMSVILPFPGAPLFRTMEKKYPYLREQDVFDLEDMRQLWVGGFTHVSMDELDEFERETKASCPEMFSIGLGERRRT